MFTCTSRTEGSRKLLPSLRTRREDCLEQIDNQLAEFAPKVGGHVVGETVENQSNASVALLNSSLL
jgi:flagellar biosynthesis/type III secretory pathway protein FliH